MIRYSRILEWMDELLVVSVSCLILLLIEGFSKKNLIDFVLFLFYYSVLLFYGFLVNSYSDRKEDRIVGKNFSFLKVSSKKSIAILIVSGGLVLFSPMLFMLLRITLLGFFIFFLATFYSLRPIRLKERGLIGVISSALARGSLPFIIFIYLSDIPIFIGVYLAVWMFITEFIGDMLHHIEDFYNDERTGTKTWIRKIGLIKSKKILKFSLFLLFIYPIVPPFFMGLLHGPFISIIVLIVSSHIYLEDLLRLI